MRAAHADLPPGARAASSSRTPTASTTASRLSRAPRTARRADFFVIERDDPEAARATIVELVTEPHPAPLRARSHDATSRCSRRCTAGRVGAIALNEALQARAQPARRRESSRGARTFRVGDKVMQLSNDYDQRRLQRRRRRRRRASNRKRATLTRALTTGTARCLRATASLDELDPGVRHAAPQVARAASTRRWSCRSSRRTS